MATPAAIAAATAAGGGNASHAAREAGHTRIRGLHLAADSRPKPRDTGLADTFQLGAHLPSAHRSKADARPVLSAIGVVPSVR